MRVADFKKKKARTMEASFEKSFDAALAQLDIVSDHMSCRERGWPDRYLGGGRWVELKSLEHLGTRHELKKEQVLKAKDLTKRGDKWWYCAKWQDSFILCSWQDFVANGMIPANCGRFYYRSKADIIEAIKYVILQ